MSSRPILPFHPAFLPFHPSYFSPYLATLYPHAQYPPNQRKHGNTATNKSPDWGQPRAWAPSNEHSHHTPPGTNNESHTNHRKTPSFLHQHRHGTKVKGSAPRRRELLDQGAHRRVVTPWPAAASTLKNGKTPLQAAPLHGEVRKMTRKSICKRSGVKWQCMRPEKGQQHPRAACFALRPHPPLPLLPTDPPQNAGWSS